MGTLVLKDNGTVTSTIPGSPANGERITMENGTLRFSITYNQHNGAQWSVDLLEFWNGSAWLTALYARDIQRIAVNGSENTTANAALTILTNTASTLQLQLQSSKTINTVVYTLTHTFTMTSTQPNIEISQYLATGAQVSLSGGNYIEDWGPCYWSVGFGSNCAAMYNGITSPSSSSRANPALWIGNTATGRQYMQNANTNRGYGGGMSMYLPANNLLVTQIIKPASYQQLTKTLVDPNTSKQDGSSDWIYAYKGYINFAKTLDGAYQAVHDNTPVWSRPGARFGDSSASTFPQAASNTDPTTTLNLTWSMMVEQPSQQNGVTGITIPRWVLPQAINRWQDTLYARPNVGGSGILGGGSGPMWQPLATLESNVTPLLASTYTTYFETTYGYWEQTGSATLRSSYTAALALQACLRWNNLGVGNSDALTMADQLAAILANYQQQSGTPKGAFYKIRDTGGNAFTCQEVPHASNGDQSHVPTYSMTECVLALIEYYRVRGNKTLAATYGNITVATLLDQAMTYLAAVIQADGGFLVEYGNTNLAVSSNARAGASYPGSATVDLAASMVQWSQLSPTATQANKTLWQTQGIRAAMYYMLSESTAHGNFEYGEAYLTWSHHGIKQLVRGFARLYRLTGSIAYLEHMVYYVELGMLLCKRIDEVVNNSATQNLDVHTGGLISTIDWNGVDSGEAWSGWAIFNTEAAALYPGGLLAYHLFYMYANLANGTWGYRDTATYQSSYPMSYAFCSPGTNYAGNAQGLDTTRFLYFMADAALMLLSTHTVVACDNASVFATCLEANLAADTPAGRTVLLYNPQGTSQTVNLTVRGQANKAATQDGVAITKTISGSDMLLGPLTLTSGQISKVVVH